MVACVPLLVGHENAWAALESALPVAGPLIFCVVATTALTALDPSRRSTSGLARTAGRAPSIGAPANADGDRSDDRLAAAVDASRADNTRRQYRYGWSQWMQWAAAHGHTVLPAAPEAVAAYLTDRAAQDVSASTLSAARAAIAAAHRDAGQPDPTADDLVGCVLRGLRRQAAGRGRGQAQAITAEGFDAILATACKSRRIGRGVESPARAQARGRVDRAIAALLFQAGLRRSEAAALTWDDVHRANDGVGVLVCVSRSKTDQEGASADTRYLKDGAARAVWELRPAGPPAGARVLGGLNGASVARRFGAAARAAGVVGRITGHSGALASLRNSRAAAPPPRRRCSPADGRRPVWSPTTRQAPPPNGAPSPSTCER